jgi:hypothetical protein
MERVKRIYGYVKKYKHAALRIRTGIPDYSALEDPKYDWMYSVYEGAKEDIPDDAPEPLGKPVLTTSYFDANLYADLLTGRSVTGVLHFLNQFPIDWHSKRQSTVATATFGSEFVAARTCTEQIIELRLVLRYLGVPIKDVSYAFGDNESVITQSTLPHSQLSKRHYALSYHKVREAVAAGFLRMHFIAGKWNPSDILTKALGYQEFWPHLKPILFWQGDTTEALPTKGSSSGIENPASIHRVLSIAHRSATTDEVTRDSILKKRNHFRQGKTGPEGLQEGQGTTVNESRSATTGKSQSTNRNDENKVRAVRKIDTRVKTGQVLSTWKTHDRERDMDGWIDREKDDPQADARDKTRNPQ